MRMTVHSIERRITGGYRVDLRSSNSDLLYIVVDEAALPSYQMGREFDIEISPTLPASAFTLPLIEEQELHT